VTADSRAAGEPSGLGVATPSASLGRTAGALYLVIIVCAGFAEGFVRARLVVPGDPVATAAAVRDAEALFRIGFVADLVAFLADAALAVVLYALLRPVGELLSLVANAFRFAQATILGLNMLNHLTPLLILGGAGYVAAFGPEATDGLIALSLDRHRHGYLIAQMFFGVHCVLLGYLVRRAWYLPSALGVLMIVAGLGYLADSLFFFLAPALAPTTSPIFIAPVVVGEVAFCLWLLVRGVRPT